MLDHDQMSETRPPEAAFRDEAGALRQDFLDRVSDAVRHHDSAVLRDLVGGLHEADTGDLIEALDSDLRSQLIELMGGNGPGVDRVAQEMYDDWAEHHHFSLYDDVAGALQALRTRGLRLGLISNTHRCLASFQSHFELDHLISVAVSSSPRVGGHSTS